MVQEYRMLDIAGILFSTVMLLIVVIQALRLDRSQAWFQTIKPKSRPAGRPWSRTS
jgi:hypothetical protein